MKYFFSFLILASTIELFSQPCTSPGTLAGADTFICPNECTTIGCEPIQGYCYKWEPSAYLDNPNSSSPLACPLETTTYTVTITDDKGNLIGTSNCTVYVYDPANPDINELLEYFQGMDFVVLPIINIVGPAMKNSKDNQTKSLNNCTVEDYANLLIEFIDGPNQGQELDLGQELENNCSGEATYYITSNESGCVSFSLIAQALNTCEQVVYWYHIFETGDPNQPDILVVGNNSIFLNACDKLSSETPGDITISGCSNFELESEIPVDPSLSGYRYTIVQRAFGPWTDFGHFPLVPGLNLSKNNFVGDNRGFSLGEHKMTGEPDPNKVSSRVYQIAEVVLGYGNNMITKDKKSSGTKGVENMLPWADPCDWNCELTANIGGNEWAENNTLYMRAFGSDPCVVFATNIDMRSKFTFSKVWLNGKNYLQVKGMILNKRFPSQEVFISDNNGKKVFLYTFGPGSESQIVNPGLLASRYDEGELIDFKIEINSNGEFLNEVIVGQSNDIYPFNSTQPLAVYPLTFSPSIELECDNGQPYVVFYYQTYSIDQWNQLNLNKDPAGDCLQLPCCGDLGCCDE